MSTKTRCRICQRKAPLIDKKCLSCGQVSRVFTAEQKRQEAVAMAKMFARAAR
jgi:hypothetical protein